MTRSTPSRPWVALIRGIGGATHSKMSMAQLRKSAEKLGLEDVSTYIATGNLLFRSDKSKAELRRSLDGIMYSHGLDNAVILRSPGELKKVLHAAPFPDAAMERAGRLLIVFYDRKVPASAVDQLQPRATSERIIALRRELCIDYSNGVAGSRLTPAVLDRTVGQPGTARNWNTLRKLLALSSTR